MARMATRSKPPPQLPAALVAELERLSALGIEPVKPPFRVREGAALIAFVVDPDGYRIELTERPN